MDRRIGRREAECDGVAARIVQAETAGFSQEGSHTLPHCARRAEAADHLRVHSAGEEVARRRRSVAARDTGDRVPGADNFSGRSTETLQQPGEVAFRSELQAKFDECGGSSICYA